MRGYRRSGFECEILLIANCEFSSETQSNEYYTWPHPACLSAVRMRANVRASSDSGRSICGTKSSHNLAATLRYRAKKSFVQNCYYKRCSDTNIGGTEIATVVDLARGCSLVLANGLERCCVSRYSSETPVSEFGQRFEVDRHSYLPWSSYIGKCWSWGHSRCIKFQAGL